MRALLRNRIRVSVVTPAARETRWRLATAGSAPRRPIIQRVWPTVLESCGWHGSDQNPIFGQGEERWGARTLPPAWPFVRDELQRGTLRWEPAL